MAFLEVESIHKYYGENAVFTNCSLSVERGSLLALTGQNGSGKSTFLACLSGLLPVDEGAIYYSANDISTSNGFEYLRTKCGLGYLPQQNLLYPALSVGQNLSLISSLVTGHGGQLSEVCDAMQLDAILFKRVEHCSQGEQRRVAIARALLCARDVLLLDEPFANLDSQSSESLLSILAARLQKGCTIVVTTHKSELLEGVLTEKRELCRDDHSAVRTGSRLRVSGDYSSTKCLLTGGRHE